MAWVVYASDSKTSGAYADLSTARRRAQEEANRTGGSAIVYPTSRTGKAKGKTHHIRPSKKNPDLAQKAFAAGQEWWHVGQHTAGVANARIVRYGFLEWWNNTSPAETKGHSKSYLEKAFREGWNRGKKGPQRIPNGRLVPARIRHKGKTYAGKVKRVNGKVKIFVTPQVARKINPAKLYFVEYFLQNSGHPVDMTIGLHSLAQAMAHGKKVAREKGYSSFRVLVKPAVYGVLPKIVKHVEIRRRGVN